jgi:hypothetical protein
MISSTAGPAGSGPGTAVIFKDADDCHDYVLAATANGPLAGVKASDTTAFNTKLQANFDTMFSTS